VGDGTRAVFLGLVARVLSGNVLGVEWGMVRHGVRLGDECVHRRRTGECQRQEDRDKSVQLISALLAPPRIVREGGAFFPSKSR
jgi:hypothetical protein